MKEQIDGRSYKRSGSEEEKRKGCTERMKIEEKKKELKEQVDRRKFRIGREKREEVTGMKHE